jgi:hypothetical protein
VVQPSGPNQALQQTAGAGSLSHALQVWQPPPLLSYFVRLHKTGAVRALGLG